MLCCDPPPPWVFWDCAPLRLHPLSSPLCSPALSVVYQDGFYGAAELYVSKFTCNQHYISVPPPHSFVSPLGVILHVHAVMRCTELPAEW